MVEEEIEVEEEIIDEFGNKKIVKVKKKVMVEKKVQKIKRGKNGEIIVLDKDGKEKVDGSGDG